MYSSPGSPGDPAREDAHVDVLPVFLAWGNSPVRAIWTNVPQLGMGSEVLDTARFVLATQTFTPRSDPCAIVSGQELAAQAGCPKEEWALHVQLALNWGSAPAGSSIQQALSIQLRAQAPVNAASAQTPEQADLDAQGEATTPTQTDKAPLATKEQAEAVASSRLRCALEAANLPWDADVWQVVASKRGKGWQYKYLCHGLTVGTREVQAVQYLQRQHLASVGGGLSERKGKFKGAASGKAGPASRPDRSPHHKTPRTRGLEAHSKGVRAKRRHCKHLVQETTAREKQVLAAWQLMLTTAGIAWEESDWKVKATWRGGCWQYRYWYKGRCLHHRLLATPPADRMQSAQQQQQQQQAATELTHSVAGSVIEADLSKDNAECSVEDRLEKQLHGMEEQDDTMRLQQQLKSIIQSMIPDMNGKPPPDGLLGASRDLEPAVAVGNVQAGRALHKNGAAGQHLTTVSDPCACTSLRPWPEQQAFSCPAGMSYTLTDAHQVLHSEHAGPAGVAADLTQQVSCKRGSTPSAADVSTPSMPSKPASAAAADSTQSQRNRPASDTAEEAECRQLTPSKRTASLAALGAPEPETHVLDEPQPKRFRRTDSINNSSADVSCTGVREPMEQAEHPAGDITSADVVTAPMDVSMYQTPGAVTDAAAVIVISSPMRKPCAEHAGLQSKALLLDQQQGAGRPADQHGGQQMWAGTQATEMQSAVGMTALPDLALELPFTRSVVIPGFIAVHKLLTQLGYDMTMSQVLQLIEPLAEHASQFVGAYTLLQQAVDVQDVELTKVLLHTGFNIPMWQPSLSQ